MFSDRVAKIFLVQICVNASLFFSRCKDSLLSRVATIFVLMVHICKGMCTHHVEGLVHYWGVYCCCTTLCICIAFVRYITLKLCRCVTVWGGRPTGGVHRARVPCTPPGYNIYPGLPQQQDPHDAVAFANHIPSPPHANGPPMPMPPPPPPTQKEESSSPPVNGPPFGKEESWPPEWFFMKESHVFAYFVAAKCCHLDTQDYFGHEREVYHGWKCLWSLFEQYCILHVAHAGAAWGLGLPNPRELTCLTCLLFFVVV